LWFLSLKAFEAYIQRPKEQKGLANESRAVMALNLKGNKLGHTTESSEQPCQTNLRKSEADAKPRRIWPKTRSNRAGTSLNLQKLKI
jgi:hypothetical protein